MKTLPHYWHGMLCTDTRDAIEERMRATLDGRYFTMVICNSFSETEWHFASVDVYPSQLVTSPITRSSINGISWCTTSLSMGVHTSARTPGEGLGGRPHKYVAFTFEGDRITIDHYAPAGYRLKWILATEQHIAEEI